MTRPMRLGSLVLVVALIIGLGWASITRHDDPPRGRQHEPDRVEVVSAGGRVVPAPLRTLPAPPAAPSAPDWTGREGAAVLRALKMPPDARIRDVTAFAQVLCGRVQPASDQPFQHFAYVRPAKLGALDDGSAAFTQTYAQLCR